VILVVHRCFELDGVGGRVDHVVPEGEPPFNRLRISVLRHCDHLQPPCGRGRAFDRREVNSGYGEGDEDRFDLHHGHQLRGVGDQRIDVDRVDAEHGYCYDEGCRAGVIEYEAGTLVLDIVDSRTNKVIWRGWAQGSVGDTLHNQDRMAQRIREGVRRMFERFPGQL